MFGIKNPDCFKAGFQLLFFVRITDNLPYSSLCPFVYFMIDFVLFYLWMDVIILVFTQMLYFRQNWHSNDKKLPPGPNLIVSANIWPIWRRKNRTSWRKRQRMIGRIYRSYPLKTYECMGGRTNPNYAGREGTLRC